MTMQFFEITPTDTLFFRDGRPFNQDETITLSGVKSMFPPSPATVAGAIMAIYAKQLGWKGFGDWGKIKDKNGKDTAENITEKLENKGKPLIFSGVFLKKNDDILFPVPQHLIELRPNGEKPNKIDDKKPCQNKDSKNRKHLELHQLAFLTPSKGYQTDMGNVHLPEVRDKSGDEVIKPLDGYWITQQGLKECLHCKINNQDEFKKHLYHQSELWQFEAKTGIERNHQTHSVEQGMLYSSTHIRLCGDVSIVIGVEDLPEEVNIDNELMILGGEARTANLDPSKPANINLGSLATQTIGNLIYIASPTPIADPQAIPNIKTACMPRQMRIGGWNSIKFKPLPLTPFLTPGTVLFMNDKVDKAKENWAKDLAPKEFTQINSVYGRYFLGEYNDNKD